jgi:hypothetical protein
VEVRANCLLGAREPLSDLNGATKYPAYTFLAWIACGVLYNSYFLNILGRNTK